MMYDLQNADKEANLSFIKAKDIINSLTLQDVEKFLRSLGVEQIVVNEDKQFLICPTICHNHIDDEASMKLYWYHDNKIFRCYTECNEAMSIFELYQKYMELNYYSVSIEEAELYVKQFLKNFIIIHEKQDTLANEIDKYSFKTQLPTLNEYPRQILSYFIKYYHPSWLKEGITKEVMKKFHISFLLSQNKIIIPHFDIRGRLVGIRGRALEEKEIEITKAKYRPIQIGNILYNHQLGFNLYGIFEHQEGIRKRKSAIIVEGEKSVLLDDVFYGPYANTVACCGSTFNKYQISLLVNYLGVNDITVALDKEYISWNDEKAKKYRARIIKLCKKYSNYAQFYYIWDYNNLLKEKDSPYDRGKQIFEQLYKERVKVN